MEYTIFILLLPLLSFLVLGIGGKWMTHRTAGIIGTTVLAVVAVLSYATAWQYFSAPRLADGTFATLMPYNVTWLPFTSTLSIDLGILLDPISVMMLIVISTVSLMVHVYSFGYMKGERGFQRYYAFLSLFTMSMLGLVVATNIFQMYLFWELVGVSSYLLIGFYYTKPSAVAASKKAFIVPITHLAAGCNGRPDTRQRIDPCSNHGGSRSLPCGPNVPAVHRLCTRRAASGSLRWSVHCILCCFGSLCAK